MAGVGPGPWKRNVPRAGALRAWARLEVFLWVLSATALSVAGWTIAEAWAFQARADRLLPPATVGSPAVVWPERIRPGTPLARLTIPSVALRAAVAEGDSSAVLRRAIGHLPRSARPGEPGNVVLAGHRDTFLRPLERVAAGDDVILESKAGRQRYRVEWTRVVEPTDLDPIADPGYPALTLVTCYPFRYLGPAPKRYVVRARLL